MKEKSKEENMKELSIEEKANAYDDALSVAQETYTTQPMYRDWLAKMFPELKESKDEKIRKEIINFIKISKPEWENYSDYSSWIAWLEKQKSDKFNDEKDEKIRNALIRFHKSTIDVDGIKGENIIAWLEKQGEQMSDPRYSILNKLIEADDIYQMSVNDTMVEEAKNKAIETLSKLEISKLLGLEKQGGITKLSEEEQNRFAKGVLSNCAMSFIDYLDAHNCEGKMCVSNGDCADIENAFHNDMWDKLHRYYCKYIEKQGEQNHANSTKTCKGEQKPVEWHREDEQNLNTCLGYIPDEYLRRWLVDVVHVKYDKPADKVEPKFKVGDWVIFNEHHNSVYQVEKIDNYRYYLRHYLGGTLSIRFDSELIRKWTIQDAKDGDVLVDKDNNIGIYKEIEGIYWDSYIYLGCDGKLYDFSVGGMHDQTQTHPATKGQRDNLLKAMAEAGWDFDFDKKELKKIKPIDEYEGLTDFERAVADACIGFIGKELGWKQYVKDNAENLLKIAVKKFNAVQPKPVWSEDDEGICRAIINDIANDKSMCKFAISKGICDEQINWLKSLKDRVACEANCTTTKQWKPSDEQMATLYKYAEQNNYDGSILTSLYNELKKLREE